MTVLSFSFFFVVLLPSLLLPPIRSAGGWWAGGDGAPNRGWEGRRRAVNNNRAVTLCFRNVSLTYARLSAFKHIACVVGRLMGYCFASVCV